MLEQRNKRLRFRFDFRLLVAAQSAVHQRRPSGASPGRLKQGPQKGDASHRGEQIDLGQGEKEAVSAVVSDGPDSPHEHI